MLKIQDLSKESGRRIVLNKINVEIENGDFFCFLGPSGSGKTALMRIIAGLEKPDSGKILLEGENLIKQEAYKRDINTIFSSFALFPDYDVYQNIEFGLNYKNISKSEKYRLVNDTIEFFELSKYTKENISKLDNLAKYKIALARALINNPKILLLDDSLKLLDRKDRLKMRYELKSLHSKLNKTFIYITDSIENAFSLSNKMAIMQHGVIHQCDTPEFIYENPKTYFVASYISNTNFFYAEILEVHDGYYIISLDDKIKIKLKTNHEVEKDRELFFAIRPERIILSSQKDINSLNNSLKGRIVQKDYVGEYTQYFVELEYGKLIVVSELNYTFLSTSNTTQITSHRVGEEIYISWSIMSGDLVYA